MKQRIGHALEARQGLEPVMAAEVDETRDAAHGRLSAPAALTHGRVNRANKTSHSRPLFSLTPTPLPKGEGYERAGKVFVQILKLIQPLIP
jgi:hypothetical protein